MYVYASAHDNLPWTTLKQKFILTTKNEYDNI